MTVFTSAGSVVSISRPTTPPVWVPIGEVETIGEVGENFGLVGRNSFRQGPRTEYMKTVMSGMSVGISAGHDPSDEGQALIGEAFASRQSYLFRIELNDALFIGWSDTQLIFPALVMNNPYGVGGSESITHRDTTIQINGAIAVIPSQNLSPPSAFVSSDWSITSVTANGATISITNLANSGGSAITDIQYRTNGGAWTSVGGATVGNYPISGLASDSSTTIQIRALNEFGAGPASDTKTALTPPAAFVSGNWSIVDNQTVTSVTLTVSAVPSPLTSIEYRLNGGAWTALGGAVPGSYPISGLTYNQALNVEIRGIGTNGTSAPSDTKTVTPTADNDTDAYIAAITVKPNTARVVLYNNLVTGLKADGIWSSISWLSIAGHNEQTWRINLRNPSQVASVFNSPTYTVDRGFTGDGAGAYAGSGISNAVVNDTNNSLFAFIGIKSSTRSNVVGSQTARHMISHGGSNNPLFYGFTTTLSTVTMASANKDFVIGSRSANDELCSSNGATGTHVTVSTTAPGVQEIRLLNTNYDGQVGASGFGTNFHVEASRNALRARILTYLTAIGAN